MLCRHLHPAPYQLLQEIQLRQRRGEAVDPEAALAGEGGTAGGPHGGPTSPTELLREKLDLASRLKRRKEARAQQPYKGFVPPYNTQSRVFDKDELRRAATHVSGAVFGGRGVWDAGV